MDTSSQANILKKRVTAAAVIVATTLIILKAYAWVQTDSVSILSSLADSFLDLIASLLNLVAVRHAMMPADREHRFGHGKIEAISALLQSFIIMLSVLYVGYEAIERLIFPAPVSKPETGLWVMGISSLLTLGLVVYQSAVLKKIRSIAIHADAVHYKVDLLLNMGIFSSILIYQYLHITWIDAIVGFGVSLYIGRAAWQIGVSAMDILMDRELPREEIHTITQILMAHPSISGFHELKTRSSGTQKFIQVHAEMDGKISLYEAHEIAEQLERNLKEAFPDAHITIHQDPSDITEEHTPL